MKKIFVLIGIRNASHDQKELWQECGKLSDSGTSLDTICRCLREISHEIVNRGGSLEIVSPVLERYNEARKEENREKAAEKRLKKKEKEKSHIYKGDISQLASLIDYHGNRQAIPFNGGGGAE